MREFATSILLAVSSVVRMATFCYFFHATATAALVPADISTLRYFFSSAAAVHRSSASDALISCTHGNSRNLRDGHRLRKLGRYCSMLSLDSSGQRFRSFAIYGGKALFFLFSEKYRLITSAMSLCDCVIKIAEQAAPARK